MRAVPGHAPPRLQNTLSRNGIDISLRQKLRIGIFHRDDAYFHMLRQTSLGGQLFSRFQLACKDVRTDAAVKRNVKRRAGRRAKRICQHDAPPFWYYHFIFIWLFQ